jgi:hypothetical protein
MVYQRPITDIIEELVEDATFTVAITSAAVVSATQVLTCDDIKHAQVGYEIELAEGDFTISAINFTNNTITVTGATPVIAAQSFDLYNPFFFHGTEPETANTLTHHTDYKNKTPMIWMRENFKEKVHPFGSRIDRTSSIELFTLTSADYNQVIDDRYTNYVRPMMRLMENFIAYMRTRTDLIDMEEVEIETETYTKFGVYAVNKGMASRLFFDNLAGQAMRLDLPVVRKGQC